MGIFWWIPALIPLIGIIILLVSPAWPVFRWEGAKSDREIKDNWFNFTAYTLVNLVACALIAWLSWYLAVSRCDFKEVWNMRVIGIRHEMRWTTHETKTEHYTTGSGDDEEEHTRTVHYTETHGPYWYRADEYGDTERIDEAEYNRWKKVWGNESQTGMHKGSSAGFDREIDGPIMECFWPNTFETTYPKSDIRKYTNKVRMSDSVFKGKEATKQQKERFPRPADKGNASPVFVYGGVGLYDDESLFLKRINASLGSSKQIHTILMVFGKDEPRSVVDDVLTAWQGPNKNELVTFVSVDGKDVRWVEVHSWMDNTALHAMLRDEIAGEPFSIMRYGELLRKYVPSMWVRKKFTPLNEYLRVPIPAGYVVWAIVLSIAVGIGSYFGISRFLAPTRGYGYR